VGDILDIQLEMIKWQLNMKQVCTYLYKTTARATSEQLALGLTLRSHSFLYSDRPKRLIKLSELSGLHGHIGQCPQ